MRTEKILIRLVDSSNLIRVFAGHTGNIDVFLHEIAHLASEYVVVVYVDLANLLDLLLYASKKSLSF